MRCDIFMGQAQPLPRATVFYPGEGVVNRVSNVPPTLQVADAGDIFRWLRELATGYFPVAPPALKENHTF